MSGNHHRSRHRAGHASRRVDPDEPRRLAGPGEPSRRAVVSGLAGLAGLTGLTGLGVLPSAGRAQAAVVSRQIAETFWRPADLGAGRLGGTVLTPNGVRIGSPLGTRGYADPWGGPAAVGYDVATWESPAVTPGFAWTELIASWNADTPPGTWVEILVRGLDGGGAPTAWFVMGRWCAADVAEGGAIARTSVTGQRAAGASVATDTLMTGGAAAFRSWQVRANLLRRSGTTVSPVLRLAGAVASAVPTAGSTSEPTSAFGGTVATLDVPSLSQEVHAGHYPQWGGGGESWCSATTTAMLLDYWGAGPRAAELAWVRPAVDAQVDVAARRVYDAAYGATGNWPFNTAYAATRSTAEGPLEGYVTRLPDLAAAEAFIRAGVPLGVSLSFTAGQLSGAGYGTDGHLMVLVGFDATGNPVVNDPASHMVADNARVRTTYRRDQFERAWANSGRTAYVVRPSRAATPPRPAPPGPPAVPVDFTPGERTIQRRW